MESSVFRNQYRELNPDEQATVLAIKTKAEEMLLLIQGNAPHVDGVPDMTVKVDGRMASIARTKLEETVMWAVKAITG